MRTHPETGRKILYVNEIFTSHIEGLAPDEGEELLVYLCRQAAVPEYQCRFQWRVNSVALWDNRATQHYALSDYWPPPASYGTVGHRWRQALLMKTLKS